MQNFFSEFKTYLHTSQSHHKKSTFSSSSHHVHEYKNIKIAFCLRCSLYKAIRNYPGVEGGVWVF